MHSTILTLKDPYNVRIAVGSIVAYNLSGEVRRGTVTAVEGVTRYGRAMNYSNEPYVVISIKEEATGRISKVTNRKNLIVLS